MDKKSTWIIAGVLGLAVIVILFISLRSNSISPAKLADVASTTQWANTPAQDVTVTPKTVITAKHTYRNGEHIIAGEIPLPTPCHLLEVSGSASEDKKTVYFDFVSSAPSAEVCAQVITQARFKVSVKAPKDAHMAATLNGQEVTLNLIEAGASDDLDNFDLYIKG